MSDWGTCRDNLDRIKEFMPLSDREKELALMQFDYTGTNGMEEDFPGHPVIEHLFEEE